MGSASTKPLRVCYFGTYRANYSRNQIMIAGLRMAGIEVVECHETLWHGIEDRYKAATGGWISPIFWARLVKVYFRLLWRYRHVSAYDVLVVGYPGILDVFLARLLANLGHKPLVWDVFMSVYLISLERSLDKKNLISMMLLRLLENIALRMPDLLIQDTEEYVSWLRATYGVTSQKFRLVPTGADDAIFQPATDPVVDDGIFRVVYYGTFIPNHGTSTIIEAANLLKQYKAIQFKMIGNGPEREKALRLAQQFELSNVEFIEWLDKSKLTAYVWRAQACLGAFGVTPQSLMTVHNKIYEGMAMAIPMISGDSPAVWSTFNHGEEIWLCKRENGAALADAIMTLWRQPDLRTKLAKNGYRRFKNEYGLEAIGNRFAAHLREVVD